MKNVRKIAGSIFLISSLMLSGLAFAADKAPPTGKVSIEEKQLGLFLGGSSGTGTLSFEGKKIPFKLKGISAGMNVGASKMSAVGEVYDLTEVSKFAGTYTKYEMSVAAGGGAGGIHLKNENGVIMNLRSRTKGLALNLGNITGLTVSLD